MALISRPVPLAYCHCKLANLKLKADSASRVGLRPGPSDRPLRAGQREKRTSGCYYATGTLLHTVALQQTQAASAREPKSRSAPKMWQHHSGTVTVSVTVAP